MSSPTARLQLLALAVLAPARVLAEPLPTSSAPLVALLELRASGMSLETSTLLRTAFTSALLRRGASFESSADDRPMPPGCLDRPACVAKRAGQTTATALIAVSALQVGLTVQVRLQGFDRSNGAAIFDAPFTIQLADLSEPDALEEPIGRLLAALPGPRPPSTELAPETSNREQAAAAPAEPAGPVVPERSALTVPAMWMLLGVSVALGGISGVLLAAYQANADVIAGIQPGDPYAGRVQQAVEQAPVNSAAGITLLVASVCGIAGSIAWIVWESRVDVAVVPQADGAALLLRF